MYPQISGGLAWHPEDRSACARTAGPPVGRCGVEDAFIACRGRNPSGPLTCANAVHDPTRESGNPIQGPGNPTQEAGSTDSRVGFPDSGVGLIRFQSRIRYR